MDQNENRQGQINEWRKKARQRAEARLAGTPLSSMAEGKFVKIGLDIAERIGKLIRTPRVQKVAMIAGGIFAAFLLFVILLPAPAPRMLVASEVYDIHHNLAATFYSENRRAVKLNDIPPFLREAFLAVEDHRFYQHGGINIGRIIKAAIHDMIHGQLEEGGSTITQQLVKNLYLGHERTFSRKIREMFLAMKLEFQMSKDQILEMYLNKIYFGHGAYGVKVAADTYFQKDLSQLNQAEMALLAGLPRGPAFYSPYNHPEKARERLRHTLERMRECKYITDEQEKVYGRQPLSLPGIKTRRNNQSSYFMDVLQSEITKLFPGNPEILYTEGLVIESTLDLKAQKAAVQSVLTGLPKLSQEKGMIPQPQGALVAIDPRNGEIRALVGGTDYAKSQFNRVVQAVRQPGSSFKSILYATALASRNYTLTSMIDRTPETYTVGGQDYCPTDEHGDSWPDKLTLRQALAVSSNVVAVKLMDQIGCKPVIAMARQLGIHSPLQPTLALALGAYGVTPMDMATAYTAFANGGMHYEPTTIKRVLDRQGHVLYQHTVSGTRVLEPGVSFLVTQALSEVIKSGTAANVNAILHRPAAGKTGTTNSYRDTWFVGYTPQLLACVFVGCDHYERALPGAASSVAAPIWANFMEKALKGQPAKNFIAPSNITSVEICKKTGLLAGGSCPKRMEYFINGTEPQKQCHSFHLFGGGGDSDDDGDIEANGEDVPPDKVPGTIEDDQDSTDEDEDEETPRHKFYHFWERLFEGF